MQERSKETPAIILTLPILIQDSAVVSRTATWQLSKGPILIAKTLTAALMDGSVRENYINDKKYF